MKHLRSNEGFTLVELIVTATFVALASAAIIEIFIVVAKLNREARNMAVATALAEQKIETYRNGGYTAIPVGTPAESFTAQLPSNFGSPKSAVSNVTEPSSGIKKVDVVITYTESKQAKNVTLTTIVAQRGINR